MSDQDLADRVKRYGDGRVGVTVTREELTLLRQAVAGLAGPTVADFASMEEADRVRHYLNAALAACDLKRKMLVILNFAEARFRE